MSSTNKNLTDAGAVWDIIFSESCTFEQNFNMRNPQMKMKMETEKGTWNISGDSLKITLNLDSLTTKMNYIYKINSDTLKLSLTHPLTKNRITTVFVRK